MTPVILIEVVLVLGSVLLFCFWQLRSLREPPPPPPPPPPPEGRSVPAAEEPPDVPPRTPPAGPARGS